MTADPRPPRLSIGLPVRNGERYLASSLDALLAQTFADIEIVISDNASTDSTSEICRHYQGRDPRVRYLRQDRNIGLSPNHNFVLDQARGELFKWASDDDLYAPDYLEVCVRAMDAYPDIVLAHPWTSIIDADGRVVAEPSYGLRTASSSAPERFRSMLFDEGGDDDLAVMRTSVARRAPRKGSHHRADRTFIAGYALFGRFYQVPRRLFFRRIHARQAGSLVGSARDWSVVMDPRRADRWRHPVPRLYAEQVTAYLAAVRRAPLSPEDRMACYRAVALWMTSRGLRWAVPARPQVA